MNIDELKSELDQIKDEKYNLLKLINHDIRSPFNRVFALLQLLEMESKEVSETQKEYIDSMYLSILGGLEMITNLRDMREIDAGNIEIENQKFDLIHTIQTAIRTFSKQCEIKKLIIKAQLSVDQAPINSDEYYVQRIIENTISNAVKFSGKDKDIIVRLSKNDAQYSIEIQDFACGINLDEEHLLYEKFKKLSSFASGGEGSLGLGLHNSNYLLNKLKGSISLQRNDQPGSSFILRFLIQ